MLRTEKQVKRQSRPSDKWSKKNSTQKIIPIKKIFDDGIFLLKNGSYTVTYRFSDINYQVASPEQQERMLLSYCDVINGIEQATLSQLDIVSRVIAKEQYEAMLLPTDIGDGLDKYRAEENRNISDKIKGGNGIVQELYFSFVTWKKTEVDARAHFKRISADIGARFNRLGSTFEQLNLNERLRIFRDFFRLGDGDFFRFDLAEAEAKGHSYKDVIAPAGMKVHKKYFEVDEKYGRAMFMREYPTYIRDKIVSDLCGIEKNMVLSVSFLPIPTAEAVREVELKRLGVETDIAKFQQKQNSQNNFSVQIPYALQQKRSETTEALDDLTLRDQRMIIATISLIHFADSIAELDTDTDTLKSIANTHMCELSPACWRQLDGINSTLPYGMNVINADRMMTTESTAAFMPFRASEICDSKGVCYGINAVSKNIIIADRFRLMNGNGIVTGVSGSGKSFLTKDEMIQLKLRYGDKLEILIIDPEREWSNPTRALGGEVIQLSAGSPHHINAMDISPDYDDKNPIFAKTEYILSLCNQVVQMGQKERGGLTAKEKSIIDRCVRKVYRDYIKNGYEGTAPTLKDFRNVLDAQNNEEAKGLSLALEMWTDGSLSAFAQETNVDIKSNLVCFDILELGESLMPVGMLVLLDQIWNRVVRNRKKGTTTIIYIDEIYLLFMEQFSAQFLYKIWKRARKFDAILTGITQNIEDLLQSNTARAMLANSEFLVMLNQSGTDRNELQKLLSISDTQMSYITDAKTGSGLLKMGSAVVPFESKFPKDTELYRLMSTKPREDFSDSPSTA